MSSVAQFDNKSTKKSRETLSEYFVRTLRPDLRARLVRVRYERGCVHLVWRGEPPHGLRAGDIVGIDGVMHRGERWAWVTLVVESEDISEWEVLA